MQNITLSADQRDIEAARERARRELTTLNEEFRRWLADYARRDQRVHRFNELMLELEGKIDTGGRKYTREEMNER